MKKNKTIEVLSTEIKIKTIEQNDFICITDKVERIKGSPENPHDLARNWMLLNRNERELKRLVGMWSNHNPDFNPVEGWTGLSKLCWL